MLFFLLCQYLELCPICNRPKKRHTFTEIQACSKKLKDVGKSGI